MPFMAFPGGWILAGHHGVIKARGWMVKRAGL